MESKMSKIIIEDAGEFGENIIFDTETDCIYCGRPHRGNKDGVCDSCFFSHRTEIALYTQF